MGNIIKAINHNPLIKPLTILINQYWKSAQYLVSTYDFFLHDE